MSEILSCAEFIYGKDYGKAVSPESQLFIIFIVPNAAVAVSLNTRYISDNSYSFRYAFETTDFLPKSAALASIISNV